MADRVPDPVERIREALKDGMDLVLFVREHGASEVTKLAWSSFDELTVEALAALGNLQAQIERYETALRAARKELSKWGYGDMHYASTPVQEESVRVTIRAIDAALAAPTEEEG